MSCIRGSNTRQRPQKYKNRMVFKNDLHDKTPLQKKLNSLHICEVCQHCKDVIEWKIKYKKYKPLTKPKTCTKCQQRNVKKAYHVLCKDCAINDRQCAKCLQSWDKVEIEPAEPIQEEQIKLKVEMDGLIKSFSERKRRSFLRYMAKGKKMEKLDKEICNEKDDDKKDNNDDDDEAKLIKRIPHTREDLLKKIDQLAIVEEEEENFDESDYSDDDDDDECESED